MKKVIIIFLCSIGLLFAKGTMSIGTYKQLTEVQEMMDKNEVKGAKKILEALLIERKENKYESSHILQALSNVYIFENDYKKVENVFKEIIKLNVLEEESLSNVKFSLARIYLSTEKYKQSITLLNELLKGKHIAKDKIYETIIFSHYYDKNYKQTVKFSKKYFIIKKSLLEKQKIVDQKAEKEAQKEAEKEAKKKSDNKVTKKNIDDKKTIEKYEIKETWYKILYSSYVELKDYPNAIITMKKMVVLFSKNEAYWVQLASLYQEVNKPKKVLSTLELAYKKDLLKKKDNVLYFINILLQNEVYFKASKLLNEAVQKEYVKEDKKIFELIVSVYINSKQENLAIKKLETSKYKSESKYTIILANLYYQKQKFKESIALLKNMKTKKDSKLEGERYILQALSYYEMQDKDECINILKKAVKNPYHKNQAKSILKQIDS